jgi:uncharacterized protein YdhG (YjbR/CyaY superfamily)
MADKNKGAQAVEAYIAQFPAEVQQKLNEMRATIRAAAPEAEERIGYQMPAFSQNGILVYYAGWKNHIGFYATPTGNEQFNKELSAYKGGKGSVQFPLDKPLPVDLIRRIVRFKLEENSKKKSRKK